MAAFSDRCLGYQIGLAFLALSLVLTVVGFSAPYWGQASWNPSSHPGSSNESTASASNASASRTPDDEPDAHEQRKSSFSEGLWMSCWSRGFEQASPMSCRSNMEWSAPGWMKAVRFLESVCLLGVGTACFYAVVVNFCRTSPGPRSRVIEGLSFVSGVIGVSGAATYTATISRQDVQQIHFNGHLDDHYPGLAWTPAWAAHVTLAGHVITLLAAIAVGVFNRPSPATSNPPGSSTTLTSTSAPSTASATASTPRYG